MKRLLLLFFAALVMIKSNGQTNYFNVCQDCYSNFHSVDFNYPQDSAISYFYFDTTQVNNIWQVGTPSKPFFSMGSYGPKVLVTDTVNPYVVNNVSSFQFSLINCAYNTVGVNCGGAGYWGVSLDIYHKIETDSGLDGGTIEVSHDNGLSWVNLIEDPTPFLEIFSPNVYTLNDTVASLGKPGYSGTLEWDVLQLYYHPFNTWGGLDTITFRFTFASDSIDTGKAGWMIGGIDVGGEFESVEEFRNDNLISISPNPTSDALRIHKTKAVDRQEIQIVNSLGEILYYNNNFIGDAIDTRDLINGVYFLKYSDSKNFSVKTFVVQH